ncbi:Nn.00g094620.m01.CDS01 [Neocucurbitaria sp. VM-36]
MSTDLEYNTTNQSDVVVPLQDMENYENFNKVFVKKMELGEDVVAVKVPLDGERIVLKQFKREIENFKILGKHDHIVGMLTYSENHATLGLAIFLDICDLGDLKHYRVEWCRQERAKGKPEQPSEVTIWKLLKDMSLGLYYLHNGLGTCYVHNDLKPGNILVAPPKGWNAADGIPAEPTFKITDFGTMTPFPTPPQGKPRGWIGTPEFAPPLGEQFAPIHPSADIWSLGATIQYFALGVLPIKSKQVVLAYRQKSGLSLPHPDVKDPWVLPYWRKRRPTVYRPLNASVERYQTLHDLPHISRDYKPYSASLNFQYSALWTLVRSVRITSEILVKNVVPLIDKEIADAKRGAKTE